MTPCSHCGADFAPGINAACRDCGLAPDTSTPPSLPAPPEGAESGGEDNVDGVVVFDVSAWPAEQRVAFGGSLRGESVPWRWEQGPVLVVRPFDEAVVEALLEQTDTYDDELWEDTEGEDADTRAQTAMSDLFDAASRLVHNPSSGDIVDEVDGLAVTVEESSPPFGIEAPVWAQMAKLAVAVVSAGAEADDEAVAGAAGNLRDFLRDYV